MVLLAISGNTSADELKIGNITIAPGEGKTLSVELINQTTMIAFEFWMQLPDGISIAKDEDGDYAITKSSTRLSKHDVIVSLDSDGRYHFLCYSSSNKTIKENTGELLSIKVQCNEDATTGTFPAIIENIIFSDDNKQRVDFADCSFNVTISSTILGDVNKDQQITIADVTSLVNILLGKDNGTTPLYDHTAADINQDMSITIADVTALVNILLGK